MRGIQTGGLTAGRQRPLAWASHLLRDEAALADATEQDGALALQACLLAKRQVSVCCWVIHSWGMQLATCKEGACLAECLDGLVLQAIKEYVQDPAHAHASLSCSQFT